MIDFGGLEGLATTEVNIAGMLTLVLLVGALGALLWIWKKPGAKADDVETTRVLAETFGRIIGNELNAVMAAVVNDQRSTGEDHAAIIGALNNHGLIMERIAQLIVGYNDKTDENIKVIGVVKEQITEVDRVVNIMSSEIDEIKRDLQGVQKKLDDINKRIAAGIIIDAESKQVMEALIKKMDLLDEKLDLVTAMAAATQKKTVPTPKPKTPGVPVTPKPVNEIEAKEKTE